MPNPLTLGTQIQAQILDTNNNVLFERNFNSRQQLEQFIQIHAKSKQGWTLLPCSVIPFRTSTISDFAEDFFLPTFIHYALKIDHFSSKVFSSILAIVWDLISLPARLVASPFRIYYNYKNPEEEHPIIALINEQPEFEQAMRNARVTLHYEFKDIRSTREPTYEDGHVFTYASEQTIKGTIQVALKRIPGGIATATSEDTRTATYIGIDNEWEVEGSSTGSSSTSSFAF